jgi:TrmH family RNA methyltransferase
MNVLSQNRAKHIRSLQQKKARQESGLFLVEGSKTILETLAAGWPVTDLVATPRFWAEHENLLVDSDLETWEASEEQLSGLGSFQNNNAALLVARQKPAQSLPLAKENLWLVLEDISDPGNLGTIIRLADWFGLKQVICLGNTVEWYNPKVIASSMGSFLRIEQVRCPAEAILQKERPWFAADMEGKSVYGDFKFPERASLLIGNEAKGLSEKWLSSPRNRLSIPRFGQAESLNAAMATGIILSHWRAGL